MTPQAELIEKFQKIKAQGWIETKRHGDQCLGNAFEDLIREKTPRLHKLVRYVYDKYGYPLSRHINTTKKADFVYYLMKPLEWIFLLVLYTFDLKPENRISVQYTGSNWRNGKIV